MDLRVAAYAVIERRGKILLTHWRRGHLHGWTLPGGGIEAGEDPRDAVVREVLEETGLNATLGKLLGVDSRVMVREDVPEGTDPEMHTIRIVYRATVQDGPLQNEVDGSSDEARWVPLKDVHALKTLSLVQTGLRMAGIQRGRGQRGGQGGQAKAGSGRSGQARGGSQKPASGRSQGQKQAPKQAAKQSSKQGSQKTGVAKGAAVKQGAAQQVTPKQGPKKQRRARAEAHAPRRSQA